MNASLQPLDLNSVPLVGVRLVEASAGTGKTYSIAALYLRLILGRGCMRPFDPPEILVLTFTRAATSELRDRIRRRLAEAARAFADKDARGDEVLGALLSETPAEQRADHARRLQTAAEWMDEAAIHTIHSWAGKMLERHAFDTGVLPETELAGADPGLLRGVMLDWWRRFVYPLAELPEGFPKTFEEFEGCLRPLLEPEVRLLAGGEAVVPRSLDAWAGARADELARRRRCEQAAREAWLAAREEIVALLRECIDAKRLHANIYKACSFERWLIEVDAWALSGGARPAALEYFAASRLEEKTKKGHEPPRHAWFGQIDALINAQSTGPDAGAPQDLPPIWAHAVDWVRSRHQRIKQQHNCIDYDDLLHELDRALAGRGAERLRARILDEYPVAFIDEFQDTDPVQWRLFQRLYMADPDPTGRALFLIGDPKQSIYGFRGADLHAYLAARDSIEPAHRYSLDRNWRSAAPMVEAVNTWFEFGAEHPRGAFAFREDGEDRLPFAPVRAAGPERAWVVDGQPAAALTLWLDSSPDGSANKDDSQSRLATHCAARIAALLRSPRTGFEVAGQPFRAVRASDFAVLVKSRFEAALIRDALARVGVSSVYFSQQDSVFGEPEALDLLAVLRAAAMPRDTRLVRRALAVPTLALSLDELDGLNRDDAALDAAVAEFMALAEHWARCGVLAMIRRLIIGREVARRQAGRGSRGERVLTNLLHLAELLQAESVRLHGEQALIDWLAEQIVEAGSDSDEARVLRLESDQDQVQILTIHKSKGLEFPVVFVPFATSLAVRKSSEKTDWIRYHDSQGRRVIELAGDAEASSRAELESLQEQLRLFYVALTRAQFACQVGLAPIKAWPHSAPGHLLCAPEDANAETLAGRLRELAARSRAIALDELCIDDPAAVPADAAWPPDAIDERAWRPARQVHRAPFEDWWIASYSSLAPSAAGGDSLPALKLAEQTADDEDDDQPPEVGSLHAFPRGAEAGTLLHWVLERAAGLGFARIAGTPALLAEELSRALAVRGWQAWRPVLEEWLPAQLNAPIRLGGASVTLAGLATAGSPHRAELEFWLSADRVDLVALDRAVCAHSFEAAPRPALSGDRINGMLRGFIDLVFEHQGRWYVADYKSNWLGADDAAYTTARMSEAMLEHRYDLQAVFYALALHRLLQVRLGGAYDPERHLGGAVYLFVRGHRHPSTAGALHLPVEAALIDEIDRHFGCMEAG
ncbi:MAG: exodeoxyribonuclease V subunit beta [Wenzhouxiangellaceae bacterium]